MFMLQSMNFIASIINRFVHLIIVLVWIQQFPTAFEVSRSTFWLRFRRGVQKTLRYASGSESEESLQTLLKFQTYKFRAIFHWVDFIVINFIVTDLRDLQGVRHSNQLKPTESLQLSEPLQPGTSGTKRPIAHEFHLTSNYAFGLYHPHIALIDKAFLFQKSSRQLLGEPLQTSGSEVQTSRDLLKANRCIPAGTALQQPICEHIPIRTSVTAASTKLFSGEKLSEGRMLRIQ